METVGERVGKRTEEWRWRQGEMERGLDRGRKRMKEMERGYKEEMERGGVEDGQKR